MASNSVCDGCGTVLGLPDAAGVVRCPSCGRVAWTEDPNDPYGPRDPEPKPSPPSPAQRPGLQAPPFATWTPGPATQAWATTAASGATRKPTKKGSSAGCLVTLLAVLGLIVGIVGMAIGASQGRGPFASLQASRIYPNGGSTIVVPGRAAGTDLVVLATDNGDGSQRKLIRVLIDDGGGQETWKSEPLPKDLYSARMVIDGDDLWVGGQDHLILLSLRTGEQKWETTLTDKLTTGCASCFSLLGDTLVLRTDDGYVSGYTAASRESRWSRRLQNAYGSVTRAGSGLFVIDETAESEGLNQVVQLDPATGKVLQTVTPSCPSDEASADPGELAGDDPIVAVPGTTDIVSWFGFSAGCVTRIDTVTGKARWATSLPDGNFEDPEDEGVAMNAGNLVFTQSSGPPVRVDLATGGASLLEDIADADVRPRAIVGTTVIGETTSTRGTATGGLAAWDLATGKRLWTTRLAPSSEPVSSGPYSSSDALFESEARTLLVTGGSTTRVVTFFGDRTIRIETLDLATGELGTPRTAKLRSRYESNGTPSLTMASVAPDRLVFHVDSIVEVLDLATGDESIWPAKN